MNSRDRMQSIDHVFESYKERADHPSRCLPSGPWVGMSAAFPVPISQVRPRAHTPGRQSPLGNFSDF